MSSNETALLDPFSRSYQSDRLASLILICIMARAYADKTVREQMSSCGPKEGMNKLFQQAAGRLEEDFRTRIWAGEFKRLLELSGRTLGAELAWLGRKEQGFKEYVDNWEEGLISLEELMTLVMSGSQGLLGS